MKVVHLLRKYNPAEWGGTETALRHLVDGLRQHGVNSTVYCPQLGGSGVGADPMARAGHPVRRFRACVPIWGLTAQQRRELVAVGGNLLSWDLLGQLWREPALAVVHAHTLGRLGAAGLLVARWRRVPFVVTIHGGVLDVPWPMKQHLSAPAAGGWEWGKIAGWLLRSRALLARADAVVTCNQREAILLRQLHPRQRVLYHPHGVSTAVFQLDHRAAALGAFPGIGGRDILLCVGRLDPQKNQGWLLAQLPELVRQNPTLLLVLAGACTNESYGQQIAERIRHDALSGHVLCTGGLPPADPRLVGLMQLADGLLLPSLAESFGLVIMEAWAAGTPVIASRTTGAVGLVRPGENGWLYDLECPEQFQQAVHELWTQPGRARQMAQAGQALVQREYDSRVVAARMKALYVELGAGAPGRLAESSRTATLKR